MLDNPEKAAKEFKALIARVDQHDQVLKGPRGIPARDFLALSDRVVSQERLILSQSQKIVHLEARVKVLETPKPTATPAPGSEDKKEGK